MRTLMLLPLLLAGCATTAATERPGTGNCNAAPAHTLVGQPGNQATAAEAMRLSGAGTLRWIQPDMAVTMDYRADRLNIELDAQQRITRISCG